MGHTVRRFTQIECSEISIKRSITGQILVRDLRVITDTGAKLRSLKLLLEEPLETLLDIHHSRRFLSDNSRCLHRFRYMDHLDRQFTCQVELELAIIQSGNKMPPGCESIPP
jgi:hypothetical protein